MEKFILDNSVNTFGVTGTFVVLENGRPKKSENNYNSNPVRQLA